MKFNEHGGFDGLDENIRIHAAAANGDALLVDHLLKAGAMTRQASTELLAQFLDPRTVAGLTLYVAAAFLYIIALRRIPLSVALPCTAASYIGAIFIGHFLYNETITLIHLTAVAFIGCGVILLALAAR